MDRLNEILQTYKYPLLLGLIGAVLIFSGSYSSSFFTPKIPEKELPKESITSSNSELIKVDIAGAVSVPGVYDLGKEMRVEDLIKKAGGFTENANSQFIAKNLNLSQKLVDGQKIYIPFEDEQSTSAMIAGISTSTTFQAANSKVKINTASQSDLESLPGIGPSTASKIIASRPYEQIEDLLSRKVVGKATFEKIKELVEL